MLKVLEKRNGLIPICQLMHYAYALSQNERYRMSCKCTIFMDFFRDPNFVV